MKSSILVICLMLFASPFYGQRVFGTVTDAKTNEPIAGVNVFIKSIKKGVTSKNTGIFYFEQADGIEKSDTILFNMVGYKTLELTFEQYENQDKKVQLTQEVIPTSKILKSSSRVITLGQRDNDSK